MPNATASSNTHGAINVDHLVDRCARCLLLVPDPVTPPAVPTPRAATAAARAAGFTLIELVVTVSVFGLLSALAYSSFERYMIKAHRSAVEQFMTDIASRQAEYLLDARTYANNIGSGGLNLATPSEVAANYTVTVTVTAGPPAGFLITASPFGRQAQDGVLTLDDTGQKLPAGKW